jgi:hypothetical protein
MVRYPADDASLGPANHRVRGVHQPSRVLDDGGHDWLEVRGRATDDTQNLRTRCLLLQRLLRLVEQPHVLNGNDCLVGEGLEEGDLPVGEGTERRPRDPDRPDGATPVQEGDRHVSASAELPRDRP